MEDYVARQMQFLILNNSFYIYIVIFEFHNSVFHIEHFVFHNVQVVYCILHPYDPYQQINFLFIIHISNCQIAMSIPISIFLPFPFPFLCNFVFIPISNSRHNTLKSTSLSLVCTRLILKLGTVTFAMICFPSSRSNSFIIVSTTGRISLKTKMEKKS